MTTTATRKKPEPVPDWREGLSPPEQLLRMLRSSQRAGVSFDVAYPLAVERVAWAHLKHFRDAERTALTDPAVVAEWRAAFEGRPTRLGDALRHVDLTALADRGPVDRSPPPPQNTTLPAVPRPREIGDRAA